MNEAFVSAITPPTPLTKPAYWFIFNGRNLLVHVTEKQATVPQLHTPAELELTVIREQYMGYCTDPENGFHTMIADVATTETAVPPDMAFLDLRRLFGTMDDKMVWLAGRAVQLAEWNRTSQFCGHCGVPTVVQTHERAKKCPQCNRTIYPRLSPAIIVLIEKVNEDGPNELLLARSHRHPPGRYSVLAGFVEPGETLETAVAREIMEEVGITVKNIRYFG
ncbi:MAG: NAD(+) diphosphatase, partial [Anaerolineales bacterium]|nr:NAD(+) diphosphatase [Anaerolineales bacterium]